MIEIHTCHRFFREKKYVFHVVFRELLNIEYTVHFDDGVENYCINFGDHRLIIEDHFFSKKPDSLNYLKDASLPPKTIFCRNQFVISDIPVLYGRDYLEVKREKQTEIICGIDIFSSIFFLLSRWEEYLIQHTSPQDKISGKDVYGYRNNIMFRPVVNEYVEFIRNILTYMGFYFDELKEKAPQLYLTHDVDNPFKWPNFSRAVLSMGKRAVSHFNIKTLIKESAYCYRVLHGKAKDPYDWFDYIMDRSESLGLKSLFFLKGGGHSKYDQFYDLRSNRVQLLLNKIDERGHDFGFHPSNDAFYNVDLWRKEKDEIEQAVNKEVNIVRQHLLRFNIPFSWQQYHENNIQVDSSCGYHDVPGFRCGTGNKFSVFNVLTRRQLKVMEQPLIFMDINHIHYLSESGMDETNVFVNMKKNALTYNTSITLLFHNTVFFNEEYRRKYDSYLSILQELN